MRVLHGTGLRHAGGPLPSEHQRRDSPSPYQRGQTDRRPRSVSLREQGSPGCTFLLEIHRRVDSRPGCRDCLLKEEDKKNRLYFHSISKDAKGTKLVEFHLFKPMSSSREMEYHSSPRNALRRK